MNIKSTTYHPVLVLITRDEHEQIKTEWEHPNIHYSIDSARDLINALIGDNRNSPKLLGEHTDFPSNPNLSKSYLVYEDDDNELYARIEKRTSQVH